MVQIRPKKRWNKNTSIEDLLNESFFSGNSEDQEAPFYEEEPKNNYSLVDILRVLNFERNPLEDLPACLRKGMPVSSEQYQKDLETLPYFMFEYLYGPDEEMEETHRDNYNGIPRLDELARYVRLGNEISLKPEGKPKGTITALLLPEDNSESAKRYNEVKILDMYCSPFVKLDLSWNHE